MVTWKKQKPEKKFRVTCPECYKIHEIDLATFNLFGYDCECMNCVDWKHVQFMRKNGKKMGLSCVKNCRCGFGK